MSTYAWEKWDSKVRLIIMIVQVNMWGLDSGSVLAIDDVPLFSHFSPQTEVSSHFQTFPSFSIHNLRSLLTTYV